MGDDIIAVAALDLLFVLLLVNDFGLLHDVVSHQLQWFVHVAPHLVPTESQ